LIVAGSSARCRLLGRCSCVRGNDECAIFGLAAYAHLVVGDGSVCCFLFHADSSALARSWRVAEPLRPTKGKPRRRGADRRCRSGTYPLNECRTYVPSAPPKSAGTAEKPRGRVTRPLVSLAQIRTGTPASTALRPFPPREARVCAASRARGRLHQ
jgi:hypothetical protein